MHYPPAPQNTSRTRPEVTSGHIQDVLNALQTGAVNPKPVDKGAPLYITGAYGFSLPSCMYMEGISERVVPDV